MTKSRKSLVPHFVKQKKNTSTNAQIQIIEPLKN